MRRIQPTTRPPQEGYPSAFEHEEALGASRRDFLRRVATGAALAGGSLLWPAGDAEAGRRQPKRHRVMVSLGGGYAYPKSDYVAERVLLQTRSGRLARFLSDKRQRRPLVTAFLAVLRKHHCRDLQNRKRLAALERELGRAAAACYQRRTRHRASVPIATLVLGKPRPVRIDGGIGMPAPPVRPPSC